MTTSPLDLLDAHDQIRALLLSAANHGLPAPKEVTTCGPSGKALIRWGAWDRDDHTDAQRIVAWMRGECGGLSLDEVSDNADGTTTARISATHDGVTLRLSCYATGVCVQVTERQPVTSWQLADNTADIDGWPPFDAAVEMGADR